MLPNKMKISERATNSLRRLQGNTGLTANVSARVAFYLSLEKGHRYNPKTDTVEHTGRELDKHTWLGDNAEIVEMLLKETYPNLTKQELYKAWVNHIDDGSVQIENKKSLLSII
ncbi:MAG: DNA sulfur modification protein DndE [Colwellia sp.]|jgi:DNA sulfur modification protein DndE